MTTNPPPPIVPPADDDGTRVFGDDEQQPVDPDVNPDLVSSADADERAATEGELDGSEDER